MDFITNLLDLNKITAKTAFLILIVAGSLLFLPSSFLERLQIVEFKKDFGKYFGFAFIASDAFLLIAFLNWFQLRISASISKKKWRKELIEAVSNLDFAEIVLLREFYFYGQQSLDMPIDNPVVAGLLKKGILVHLSSMGSGSLEGIMFPLSINRHLKKYINPTNLGLPDNPSEQKINEIRNERPDWVKSGESRKANRLW